MISLLIYYSQYGLTTHIIGGQGYDGASNLRGAFNSMKTFIMKEVESVHSILDFSFVKLIGSSYKHRDMLREKQSTIVVEALAAIFFYFVNLFYAN
uniref:Uncharacterized protein n=1 Tax=Lactuca sativa TaxID=4236 RepID=A0A9R1WPR7_LACSA|nr:hypothetical protein LSAT_V11C100039510 [Lactuca sativa]